MAISRNTKTLVYAAGAGIAVGLSLYFCEVSAPLGWVIAIVIGPIIIGWQVKGNGRAVVDSIVFNCCASIAGLLLSFVTYDPRLNRPEWEESALWSVVVMMIAVAAGWLVSTITVVAKSSVTR